LAIASTEADVMKKEDISVSS